ncbi:hypothetical protein [Roseibium sp. RKSG952]|uniref:hypothetical protein n=1 Tax=Roseibium sp. RKSG952 TaxID=2529384 RepID=UPI0012BC88E7|nr:hypothetical protein [Roseibium sp. RKSG952]MTH95839.1 hypothetical protein [Roseibium sp. RKSG952]
MRLTVTEATNAIKALATSLEPLKPTLVAVIDAAVPRAESELEAILDERGREIGKDWMYFSRLCLVLERLEKAVSKANSDLRIGEIIAEEADHERRARYLRYVVNSQPAPPVKSLKDALAGSRDGVETSVLSEVVLQRYADKLDYSEQSRNELAAKRRFLGITNNIEISDDDYEILKALNAV